MAILNLYIGSVSISAGDLLRVLLLREETDGYYAIIWKIRFPRMLMAGMLGGALSVSGFLLQTFFHNPIAGPYVLGISSGAKLIVALVMIVFIGNYGSVSSYGLIFAAFLGSLVVTGCILVVQLAGERFYPSGEMLGTACFLVTGWNYMAALRTVYSPLNLYRTIIIYGMELVFFLAAVLFQNILTLRPLEFGMLILVFVLMTFSPLVIKVITDWLHRGYRRSLDEKPKSFLYRMVVFLKSRHIGKQE